MQRLLTALTGVAAAHIAAAQDEPFQINSMELVPGLYMLDSADERFVGGNMGLLMGPDGVVLIDDGIPEVESAYLDAVKGLTGRRIDYVINTHIHADHTGNNHVLREMGATVVAHQKLRDRMAGQVGAGLFVTESLPTLTYDNELAIYINGFELKALHVPSAHTDGDSILHMPTVNVIFPGDILFNGMFPFVDLASGGSVDGMLRGLDVVLALADDETRIVSGHGPLANRGDVQRARNVLADSRDRVAALVDQGLSEDETVAANPLESFHAEWNWEFITTERMTRTLFQSLSQ